MGRLRYLVFSVAIRSHGNVRAFEDALSAMTMGHIAERLGELRDAPGVNKADNAADKGLELLKRPISDPEQLSAEFRRLAAERRASGTGLSGTLVWLFDRAAANLDGHGPFLSWGPTRRPD